MMVRYIFGCAVFLLLSILAVPVYYGIAEQRENIATPVEVSQNDESLSFEDIYKIAAEGRDMDAAALNDIAPAAGDGQEDAFTSGFQNTENPALAEEPTDIMSEEQKPAL